MIINSSFSQNTENWFNFLDFLLLTFSFILSLFFYTFFFVVGFFYLFYTELIYISFIEKPLFILEWKNIKYINNIINNLFVPLAFFTDLYFFLDISLIWTKKMINLLGSLMIIADEWCQLKSKTWDIKHLLNYINYHSQLINTIFYLKLLWKLNKEMQKNK